MKRKLLSLILFAPVLLFAQPPQRMVLVEHFSNASCGPCAAQNPALNSLLENNASKAIALKYQVSWPGTDPMNAQNASDASARVSYYNVSGVPSSRVDGPAYAGAPSGVTQSLINNRYSTATNYFLTVTHTFSPNMDSVYMTYTVTADQAYTATGALKLHVVLTEKVIEFTSPPGSNGELTFKNVMRKMYPDNSGLSLASTWTAGQTLSATISAAIPSYIYDLGQLEVVAFIQENGSKIVHQSAKSAAQPLAIDAAVTAISGLPFIQCTPTVNPSFTLKNAGANTMTSADIEIKLDNGTPSIVNWTGTLTTGSTTNVAIPAITSTNGGHILSAKVTQVNGNPDLNTGNNTASGIFYLYILSAPAQITEGFESNFFPPTDWANYNPGSSYGWHGVSGITGPAGTSTKASLIYFFNIPQNEVNDLHMPQVSFAGSTSDTFSLKFDVAYAQYSTTTNDKLEIKVSTDCGNNWVSVFSKSGASLSTRAPITTNWQPNSADNWRNEVVDLSSFAGNSDVMIKFSATSAYGNNGFIDNVNLSRSGSVKTELLNLFGADALGQNYPNPSEGQTHINLNDIKEGMHLEVTDMTGRLISVHKLTAAQNQLTLNTKNLSNGVYSYHLMYQGIKISTRKMTVKN